MRVLSVSQDGDKNVHVNNIYATQKEMSTTTNILFSEINLINGIDRTLVLDI